MCTSCSPPFGLRVLHFVTAQDRLRRVNSIAICFGRPSEIGAAWGEVCILPVSLIAGQHRAISAHVAPASIGEDLNRNFS